MPYRLYIVRHAWAGEHGDPDWPDDDQRPLTAEGRTRFACVVRKLIKKRDVAPEMIATSPLVRCVQTAEMLAARLSEDTPLVVRRELQPGSELRAMLAWSNAQRVRSLAWVGHAPDVLVLTQALAPGAELPKFAKGAVVAIDFADALAAGQGRLAWYQSAKSLDC